MTFQYQPYQSPYTGSIADLMGAPARAQANALRVSADAQARAAEASGQRAMALAGNLGQIAQGVGNSILQYKADAPRREAEALHLEGVKDQRRAAVAQSAEQSAVDSLLNDALMTDPDTGVLTYDRTRLQQGLTEMGLGARWTEYAGLLDKADASIKAVKASQAEALKSVAEIVDRTGNDPMVFARELKRAMENGLVRENDAMPYLQKVQQEPQSVAKITAAILGKKPGTREIKVTNLDGSETILIVADTAGQSFTSAPKPEKVTFTEPREFLVNGRRMLVRSGSDGFLYSVNREKLDGAAVRPIPEKGEDPLTRQINQTRLALLQQQLADAQKPKAAAGSKQAEQIMPVLNEIERLAVGTPNAEGAYPGGIFNASGPMANLRGAGRSALAGANMDDDVKVYRALVRGMTPLIARAVGHTGVLTEQDVDRTETLFPQMGMLGTDSKTVAERKMQQVKRLIAGQGTDADKQQVRQDLGWGEGGGDRVYYDENGNPIKK